VSIEVPSALLMPGTIQMTMPCKTMSCRQSRISVLQTHGDQVGDCSLPCKHPVV
jgi:hypothetical protein